MWLSEYDIIYVDDFQNTSKNISNEDVLLHIATNVSIIHIYNT